MRMSKLLNRLCCIQCESCSVNHKSMNAPKEFPNDEVIRTDPDKLQEEEEDPEMAKLKGKMTKGAILKNVFLISLSFVFLFTSYNAMSFLQSSINSDVGTNSLAVIYAGLILSCFFVPSWAIDKLNEKRAIGCSMWGYLLYIAAQFYPTKYTLLPSAFLVGLCAAPLWSAKCTYLTHVAKKYAKIVGERDEVLITRFFGIFFCFFQSTYIWGNIIASTVLSTDPTVVTANDTDRLMKCGVNYCPGYTNSSVVLKNEVSTSQRYTMSSIYLIVAAFASVIIFLFVDPLSRFREENDRETKGKTGKELLIATVHHMRHPYQLLIIPLTVWSGIEQGFFGADFTASYVGCGLGVYMVGYVLICYGACDAFGSLVYSDMVQIVGRTYVFSFGAVVNTAMIIALLSWMPNPDHTAVFFIISGLWGIADAVWQTQINSFYGLLFPKTSEAAFSNYRLWESVGFIIAYICSSLLCTQTKIYMMIGFLSFGMIGYFTIEVLEKYKILPRDEEGNIVSIYQVIIRTVL